MTEGVLYEQIRSLFHQCISGGDVDEYTEQVLQLMRVVYLFWDSWNGELIDVFATYEKAEAHKDRIVAMGDVDQGWFIEERVVR